MAFIDRRNEAVHDYVDIDPKVYLKSIEDFYKEALQTFSSES